MSDLSVSSSGLADLCIEAVAVEKQYSCLDETLVSTYCKDLCIEVAEVEK